MLKITPKTYQSCLHKQSVLLFTQLKMYFFHLVTRSEKLKSDLLIIQCSLKNQKISVCHAVFTSISWTDRKTSAVSFGPVITHFSNIYQCYSAELFLRSAGRLFSKRKSTDRQLDRRENNLFGYIVYNHAEQYGCHGIRKNLYKTHVND